MKKCPACAEEIQDEAVKCKHCGHMLDGKEKNSESSVVFKVILEDIGEGLNKIRVINEVRKSMNLGLKEANDFVDGASKTMTKKEAEELKKRFEAIGAKIKIVPLRDIDGKKMKKCLSCGEEILDEAVKCKHCGCDNQLETLRVKKKKIKIKDVFAFIGGISLVICGIAFIFSNEGKSFMEANIPLMWGLGFVFITSLWVFVDAKIHKGEGAGGLFVSCLFLWVICFPLYWLYNRPRWLYKKCPKCAEKIKRVAVVCKYCGNKFTEIGFD